MTELFNGLLNAFEEIGEMENNTNLIKHVEKIRKESLNEEVNNMITIKQIVDKMNDWYSKIYDAQANDENLVPDLSVDEVEQIGSSIFDNYLSTKQKELIRKIVDYRDDFISSDREAAALSWALHDLGLLDWGLTRNDDGFDGSLDDLKIDQIKLDEDVDVDDIWKEDNNDEVFYKDIFTVWGEDGLHCIAEFDSEEEAINFAKLNADAVEVRKEYTEVSPDSLSAIDVDTVWLKEDINSNDKKIDFAKDKYDKLPVGYKFGESLQEASKKTKIIDVTPIYTGGNIYIFEGALSDGTYFIACDEEWDVRIVDKDPRKARKDKSGSKLSEFPEWQEKHLVKDMDCTKTDGFFREMLNWILENEPKGNYNSGDIRGLLDRLEDEFSNLEEDFKYIKEDKQDDIWDLSDKVEKLSAVYMAYPNNDNSGVEAHTQWQSSSKKAMNDYVEVSKALGKDYDIKVVREETRDNGKGFSLLLNIKPNKKVDEAKKKDLEIIPDHEKSLSMLNHDLGESIFERTYDDCYVEFRDDQPWFAYSTYSDASKGILYDKAADNEYGDNNIHKYEIKYLKDGEYSPVDKPLTEETKKEFSVGSERTLTPEEKPYEYFKTITDKLNSLDAVSKWTGKKYKFYLEDVYLDFGSKWMWTTIIAEDEDGDTHQILDPNEWLRIANGENADDIIEDIMKDKYCQFRLKESLVENDNLKEEINVSNAIYSLTFDTREDLETAAKVLTKQKFYVKVPDGSAKYMEVYCGEPDRARVNDILNDLKIKFLDESLEDSSWDKVAKAVLDYVDDSLYFYGDDYELLPTSTSEIVDYLTKNEFDVEDIELDRLVDQVLSDKGYIIRNNKWVKDEPINEATKVELTRASKDALRRAIKVLPGEDLVPLKVYHRVLQACEVNNKFVYDNLVKNKDAALKFLSELLNKNLKEDTDYLTEMAMSRANAIELCMDLGKQFVNHFDKVYNDNDENTIKHHGKEMQTWFNKVLNIKLKENNKPLNEKQIYDWFITCGQLPSDLFENETEASVYTEFSDELLDEDKDVLNALKKVELLNENLKEDFDELSAGYEPIYDELLAGVNADVPNNIKKVFNELGGTVKLSTRPNSISVDGNIKGYTVGKLILLSDLERDLKSLAKDLQVAKKKTNENLKEDLSVLDKYSDVKEYVEWIIDHSEWDKTEGVYSVIDISEDTDFAELVKKHNLTKEDIDSISDYIIDEIDRMNKEKTYNSPIREEKLNESSIVLDQVKTDKELIDVCWNKGETYTVRKFWRTDEDDVWSTEFVRYYSSEESARRAFNRYKKTLLSKNQLVTDEDVLSEDTNYEEDVEMCDWCGELVPESDIFDTNYGKLCSQCIQAIKSKGEYISIHYDYDEDLDEQVWE